MFLVDRNTIQQPWVLGIDGKWLRRKGVVMIYRDVTNKTNLYWSFHLSESYTAIEKDFEKVILIIKDRLPSGVITDWKGAIVSAVNTFLISSTPHQRCLSHVQRELLRLLPLRSPLLSTQKLRIIAKVITDIETHEEKYYWLSSVNYWISKYDDLLKEKTVGIGTKKKWWYTHGKTRRAIKLLTFDEKHLFTYLDLVHLFPVPIILLKDQLTIKTKLSNHRGINSSTGYLSFLVVYF